MVNSINTNSLSFSNLQTLNRNISTGNDIQNRISTGKKVDSPKDDAATFAIAQQLLGEVGGVRAVQDGLNTAGAITDVAIASGEEISDLLVQAKGIAVQASQEGLDQASRDALNAEFAAVKDQIGSIVEAAEFGGTNLIEAGAADLSVLSSETGDQFNVAAQDLSTAGLGLDGLDLSTAGNAASAAASLDTIVGDVSSKLSSLGASAQRIDSQAEAASKLQDTLRSGIGNLVDANLGAEAANLAANRVAQALSAESSNIANRAPQYLLKLFGNA